MPPRVASRLDEEENKEGPPVDNLRELTNDGWKGRVIMVDPLQRGEGFAPFYVAGDYATRTDIVGPPGRGTARRLHRLADRSGEDGGDPAKIADLILELQ